MGSHRSRLPLVIVVAVVAAGAATLVLRPHGGLIEPAAVEAEEYFSASEIDRAEGFRSLQRVIGIAGLVVTGLTLALLALRPPAFARRALTRAAGGRLRAAALVGAGISLAVAAADLPLALWAHERSVDVGLSTQSLGPWLGDVAKSTAIAALFAAGGAVLALALIRRFPRHWWAPGSAAIVVVAVLYIYLAPVAIDPLFNRFEPVREGQLRSQVLALADQAGVDVGEVLRVDASRRTSALNAYVGGIGHTKRVVLYDNLIDDVPRPETLSVVAHELGHVEGRDVPRGLLWLAIVAPAGMLVVQRLAEAIARRSRGEPLGTPATLPAVALALALTAFALTCAGNVLSRAVEARADAYAIELTRDPKAAIALERRLAVRNLSDPDPPRLTHALFGTHPTTLDRIGIGVAFERRADRD